MRIAVFGSGGVGGYFGGRLAEAGVDVSFVARGAHLAAIRERGLRVDSVAGDFTVTAARASDDPAEIGAVDAVLLGVKAWQVREAAEAMKPLIGPGTVVVPLLNGVEAPAQLAAILGEGPVLGGLCGVMAFIEGPGHIRHAGIDPFIRFGELDKARSERVERLAEVFTGAKAVRCEIPEDIHVAMWRKFLFIAASGGVGALARAPFGIVRDQPETAALVEAAMKEIAAVGRARGVALAEDAAPKAFAQYQALPAGGTASMQRDIVSGRPSELEAQSGAVVRLGAAAGVPTPVNAFVHACLLPLERRARGEVEFD